MHLFKIGMYFLGCTLIMLISALLFVVSGCASQFEQIVDVREQNFHVQCDNSETLFGSSLEECKVAACDYGSVVFHYLDDVCVILLCWASRREDLTLTPVTTAGWDIYFRTEVNSGSPPTSTVLLASETDSKSPELTFTPTETENMTQSISTSNEEPGPLLPVWATAVIISGATLCIVTIIAIGIVFGRRHQKQNQAADSATREREGGERREERDGSTQAAPYEEITNSDSAMRVMSEDGFVVYHNNEDPDGYLTFLPNN